MSTEAPRTSWLSRRSASEIIILTMLAGTVLVAALGLAAAYLPSGSNSGGGSSERPESDVTMTSCVTTDYGSPKANLTVHNSTDRRRDYAITVVFERSGVQTGSGVARVVDLSAGQTAETFAVGFGADTGGAITCRVSDVSRR